MRTFLAVLILSCASAFANYSPSLVLPKAKESLFCDLEIANGQLVSVGERGHIFVGDPSSLDLQQVPCPVNQFLTAVTFDGENHFWATGHDQVILKGSRDGSNWEVVHFDPDLGQPLFDISFLPSGEGLAVGAFGSALHTADRGKTWKPIVLDEMEPHFYKIQPGPSNSFYVAAEFGTLLRLNAQGEVTQRFDTGSEATFFGVFVEDEQHITLYGLRGLILRTEDGSIFTRDDANTTASFFHGIGVNGQVWLMGGAGNLYNLNEKNLKSAGEERGLVVTSGQQHEKSLILTTTSGIRRFDYE